MEGTNTRTFPRMLLDKPVEVQINGDTIRVENPSNNLSVGGLFLHRSGLPVGASVRVRISSPKPFEAEGRIFNCGNGEAGAGIGFEFPFGRKPRGAERPDRRPYAPRTPGSVGRTQSETKQALTRSSRLT